MTKRGKTVSYTRAWDLSGIPHYAPKTQVTGTIRMWGSNYITDGYLGSYWETAFRKYHPGARFEFRMKTTLAAVPSLIFGVSDLGIGRKITFSEQEFFERYTDPVYRDRTVRVGVDSSGQVTGLRVDNRIGFASPPGRGI